MPPPSCETPRLAGKLGAAMRQAALRRPTRVVLDAHGGMVFGYERDAECHTSRVVSGGKVELNVFPEAGCYTARRKAFETLHVLLGRGE